MNSGNDIASSRTKQLEYICSSGDLSFAKLCRVIEGKRYLCTDLYKSAFLHRVCLNKNVTFEIVKYLLDLYPALLHYEMKVDDIVITSYPLHLACYNKHCPNEVIRLLLERLGSFAVNVQLTHVCYMNYDWGSTGIESWIASQTSGADGYGGTPLHYYLSRTSNVDLYIVKELVIDSRVLLYTDVNTDSAPIHILMHNKGIGEMFNVVKYLAETNPSSLNSLDGQEHTPLDLACMNGSITAKTIDLLLRVCPGSIYQSNNRGGLPIHTVCDGDIDDEVVAMEVLNLLLKAQPDLVTRPTDEEDSLSDGDELPLHRAAANRSPSFCKILVHAHPEAVEMVDSAGCLPFHNACYEGRPDTVEYLFGLHPESLHIRNHYGYLPIHWTVLGYREEYTVEIVQFLILHDSECVSKSIVSDDGGDQHLHGNGTLPLHIVCSSMNLYDQREVMLLLFNLYPEAVLIRNGQQQLPIDILREKLDDLPIDPDTGKVYNEDLYHRMECITSFLQTQMNYARKAQDETFMRTPDATGSLPLHYAIRAGAPLGSIKLLVKGNPNAATVPDGSGMFPLHVASEMSTVGVVEYLAELSPEHLDDCDTNKNFPLHHACRGVNCEVIAYLLDRPISSVSVSERNADGMLPIHLFCVYVNEQDEEGEDTPVYTETIWRLLTAYPETLRVGN